MTLHPGRIMEANFIIIITQQSVWVSLLMNFPARLLNASINMCIGGSFCILAIV